MGKKAIQQERGGGACARELFRFSDLTCGRRLVLLVASKGSKKRHERAIAHGSLLDFEGKVQGPKSLPETAPSFWLAKKGIEDGPCGASRAAVSTDLGGGGGKLDADFGGVGCRAGVGVM